MPSGRICLLVLASASLFLASPGDVSFRVQQQRFPRVQTAAKEKDELLKQLFVSKGVGYPPKAILLRAFKKVGELELWVERSGGAFVHCVTIGCIPVTDDGIKEIHWLAMLARNNGQVHIPIEIFPARLTAAGLDQLASPQRNQADLVQFCMNLKEGYDFFEMHHQAPVVRIDGGGRYAFSAK
jgi:murein L,D-transpeptidase YafK